MPGDEPRRLDWRVLGWTDRPYIKEYDEETNLRCILMLDGSGSMAYGGRAGTKFDYACRLLAALAYLMLGNTESVGLCIFGEKLEQWIGPHSGTAQLSRIVDTLERRPARAVESGQGHAPGGRPFGSPGIGDFGFGFFVTVVGGARGSGGFCPRSP